MSDGIDFKGIGLAAKDVVLGIAGAAAGASGGPAGAEAVNKIGTGLDKALAMGGIGGEEKKPAPRGESFDRDGKPPPQKLVAQRDRSAPHASPQAPADEEGPLVGDTRTTVDQLRALGWNRKQIQQILGGPEQTDLASLTRRQTGGRRAPGVEGKLVASVSGTSTPALPGQAVRGARGRSVPVAFGKKVGPDDDDSSA